MEIGLTQLLAIPVVIVVVICFAGYTVKGISAAAIGNFIIMAAFLLSTSGVICLKIGYEERVKLRDQEDNIENSPDCPKKKIKIT